MNAYRRLWNGLVAVVTAAAVAAMVSRSDPSQVVALVVALGSLGAVLGMAWGSELPTPRHPVLVGTAVASVAALALPGLAGLVGWWAAPACVLLAAGSPPVVGSVRVRRARIARPAPAADPAGARLRAEWAATTRALSATSCSEDRMLVAELRGRLLAEIEEHHGMLPAYVWEPAVAHRAGSDGRERSGP